MNVDHILPVVSHAVVAACLGIRLGGRIGVVARGLGSDSRPSGG